MVFLLLVLLSHPECLTEIMSNFADSNCIQDKSDT